MRPPVQLIDYDHGSAVDLVNRMVCALLELLHQMGLQVGDMQKQLPMQVRRLLRFTGRAPNPEQYRPNQVPQTS